MILKVIILIDCGIALKVPLTLGTEAMSVAHQTG